MFSCSFRAQSNTALTEHSTTFRHSIKQAEIQLLDSLTPARLNCTQQCAEVYNFYSRLLQP